MTKKEIKELAKDLFKGIVGGILLCAILTIIFLGIDIPGLMRLVNSSENLPLINRQADISVIWSTSGFKPVVSKSKEIYSSNFMRGRRSER